MSELQSTPESLSPWWKNALILLLIAGFSILIFLAVRSYQDAPPVPGKVVNEAGAIVFTGEDITGGQQVFLRYALMENGSIWGHGAYLGPDFSAEYLHRLSADAADLIARGRFSRPPSALSQPEQEEVAAQVSSLLKQNRYDPASGVLVFSGPEELSYRKQIGEWSHYLSRPGVNVGLPAKYITDSAELSQLTSFFAWTAWASVANRRGESYSYTNNFPYDPSVGNLPTGNAVLWSALSLVSLLGALALVLFIFGKFDYLGWKSKSKHVHPQLLPGATTESQRATIKYFVAVAALFLAQSLIGGGVAHYRSDPESFYGLDLSPLFSSNILRTWHLQLAIFWIATAYIGGGLFLASSLGGVQSRMQTVGIHFLFMALIVVTAGSLLGELAGVRQLLGNLWFWFGHQGWEYLDLGRAWQILLAIGLVLWLLLLMKDILTARKDAEKREISSLFLYAAIAIPLFYMPAMFFSSTTNFTVVDTWRFWIIHLWVEGFFELFVTVMVAVMFFKLGLVTHQTAARVVYLDGILYLGSGIVGTGHHWYWTGQSAVTMALGAVFSAMEVVPLTLLTLDAWDFMKLSHSKCDVCGKQVAIPHKWTFYFLMAGGFWNFVGAGVFGFLINLPIVSYFEVGTMLTPNHGHAAMMGVFGMLAVALLVFALRQVLSDEEWVRPEKYVRVSFWGLNVGLALMVVLNLFPGGVLQLSDVLQNGYWHARSQVFAQGGVMKVIEWLRLPADSIFIVLGALPLFVASAVVYRIVRSHRAQSS
jgi:nitric oxide reductase subunit B